MCDCTETNKKMTNEKIGMEHQQGATWVAKASTHSVSFEDQALDNLFTYHPPTGDAHLRYENIRSAAKAFAKAVLVNVPIGAEERRMAVNQIRIAVMLANAGVSLVGLPTQIY